MDNTEWIQKAQYGDMAAFRQLVDFYMPVILNYAYRYVREPMDAYDITQEVLIKVHKNLHKYNPNYKFTTWLYKITTRCAIDVIRQKERQQRIRDKQEINQSQPTNHLTMAIDDVLIKKESDEVLYDAIKQLPMKLQMVLVLYYFEHLSQNEIATILEIPLGTVHSRMNQCKKKLKKCLDSKKGDF